MQVELTDELRNPAGTLQGAMVALLAEAAAEDLVQARFGRPAIVTDLDLRYLAPTGTGPVRTTTRLLGKRADSAIEVELVDVSTGTLTTLVYRAPVDGSRREPREAVALQALTPARARWGRATTTNESAGSPLGREKVSRPFTWSLATSTWGLWKSQR